MLDLDRLDFAKGNGFVTVVAQDARTRTVLMVARADREALERSIATREMHYHSRTRGLWHKGATSGHVQRIVSMTPDCDGDSVLARVVPAGPACHTGSVSCFEGAEEEAGAAVADRSAAAAATRDPVREGLEGRESVDVLERLARTIEARSKHEGEDGEGSYTRRLLGDRNLRLKKLGEEATELAVACADGDRARAVEEASDLLYHTLVALSALGASLDDVRATLAGRER